MPPRRSRTSRAPRSSPSGAGGRIGSRRRRRRRAMPCAASIATEAGRVVALPRRGEGEAASNTRGPVRRSLGNDRKGRNAVKYLLLLYDDAEAVATLSADQR